MPPSTRLALDTLALDPRRTLMVAAHPWDLRAAAAHGLRTAYIQRAGEGSPAPSDTFDLTVPDLAALAASTCRRPTTLTAPAATRHQTGVKPRTKNPPASTTRGRCGSSWTVWRRAPSLHPAEAESPEVPRMLGSCLTVRLVLANALQPWGLLAAPVGLAVRDPEQTPYCAESPDPCCLECLRSSGRMRTSSMRCRRQAASAPLAADARAGASRAGEAA